MLKINNMRKLLFIFPITYIIYLLYARLNPRPPRDLLLCMSPEQIIITCSLILIFSFRVYFLLKKENILSTKPITNKYLLLVIKNLKGISEIFNHIWIDFFRVLLDKYFSLNLYLVKFINYLYSFISPKGFNTIIFLDILPRLLVVILFLIEIIFFKKINFFYKSLILLLIPLSIKLVDKIILQFYEDNYPGAREGLHITTKPDPNNPHGPHLYSYKYAEGFIPPDFVKSLHDYLYNHYVPLRDIPNLLERFASMRNRLKYSYVDIFIAAMYLIGWIIILYLGYLSQ